MKNFQKRSLRFILIMISIQCFTAEGLSQEKSKDVPVSSPRTSLTIPFSPRPPTLRKEMNFSSIDLKPSSFFSSKIIWALGMEKECNNGLPLQIHTNGCLYKRPKPTIQITKNIRIFLRGNVHSVRGGIKITF